VRVHHPDYLVEIADLLADREIPVRKMAAQALAYSENPAAVPLLRLKALVGDDDPQVLGEVLTALLSLAPHPSLAFVERFLDRDDVAIAEAAALALGASRRPEALAILGGFWERTIDVALRRAALLAVAMLKHDEAIDYLLGHVRDSAPLHAREAIRAGGLGTIRAGARRSTQSYGNATKRRCAAPSARHLATSGLLHRRIPSLPIGATKSLDALPRAGMRIARPPSSARSARAR
jgi:hypothetical protein